MIPAERMDPIAMEHKMPEFVSDGPALPYGDLVVIAVDRYIARFADHHSGDGWIVEGYGNDADNA
jgi:hypothetical protein